MIKNITYPHLDAVVMVGLTCVEQGLESKQAVRDTIKGYVADHYIQADRVTRPEDILVSTLERLHDTFGFDFEAHGGTLTVCLPA